MDEKLRQTLCQIITQDRSLHSDPPRCRGMLSDELLGRYTKEIKIIVAAIEEGIPAKLLALPGQQLTQVQLNTLKKELQRQRFLEEDTAQWIVESWALALGVISKTEGKNPVYDSSETQYIYTLILTIASAGDKTWQYSINLEEFYEDSPDRFFTDFNGQERQKIEDALRRELGRKIQISESDKILQEWCRQISFGYRTAYVDI